MSEIRIIGPDGQRFVFPAGTDPETMKAAMRRRYTGETRRGREMILEGQLPDQSLTAAQQYLARDQLQRDLEAGRAAAATEAATGPENVAKERFYTGAQGVTLGAAPLIQGAVNVPLAALMFPFLTEEQRAGRDLGQFVADMSGAGYAQARGNIERAREKRPLESAGIEIAGGLLTGKTVYDELGRRFLANQTGARGALVGAGATGQYEFLESEGDPAAAARGALIGAPVGAGVSKALEATAEPLGRMFRGEVPVPPEATNTLVGAGIGAAGPAETPEERARNIAIGAGLGYGGTKLGAMGRRTVGAEPTTPAGGYFNRQSMRLPGVGPTAREAELAETWRETRPIVQTARTAASSGEQAADIAVQSRAPGDIARAKDAKNALIREIETAQAARAGMDTPEDARLADALEALRENTSDPLLISSQIGAAKTSLERLLTDLGRPTMPSTMGRAPLRPPLRRTFSAEEESRLAPEAPEPLSRTRYAEGEVPPVKGMGFGASEPPKPVRDARAAGYEGTDRGESAEWMSAVRKGLRMDTESRMARAREMGFDTETVLYHGTPDARPIEAAGQFEKRSQYASYLSDPDRYQQIQAEMAAERAANGVSAKYMALLEEAQKLNVDAKAPRPVYMSDSSATAKTYARDDRAFDYQGAEPKVMPLYVRGNMLKLDAGGLRFSMLPINVVRRGIPQERLPEFDRLVTRYSRDLTGNGGRMSTADIELIAHDMGYDGFTIRNIVDDYQGKGGKSTVTAVFDPSNIRSVHAAFDPEKAGSSTLLAAAPFAAVGGVGAGMTNDED